MFYTIYQITHIESGKIYIGKHQTKKLDDGYMGSGKVLRCAIKKHGIENFEKVILHVFDSETEMNAREAELVSEEFVAREDTYNLCPGGRGGFGYINNSDIRRTDGMLGKKHSDATKAKIRDSQIGKYISLETREKISKSRNSIEPWNKGKSLSVEDRKNKSLSQMGKRNSQFGTMWITNGSENRKINKNITIPPGWLPGRKIKRNSTNGFQR